MEEPTKKEEPKKFNLLEWTTIIYAFLTFLGYSYIDTYYNQWGIRIYSFLDASEILLVFLKNITILIPVIMLLYLYVYRILSIDNHDEKESLRTKLAKMSLEKYILLVVLTYVLLTCVMLPLGFILQLNRGFSFDIVLMVLMIYLIMHLSIAMINFKGVFTNRNKPARITLILILLYSLNYSYARYQFKDARYKRNNTRFSFSNESKNYKSNDTLLFIGTTSKYIFIRNTKDSTNLIFEKSNSKNLSLTEERNIKK